MSNENTIHVFRGKTSFAKILGDPVLNYAKDGKLWQMDLQIDKDTVKEMKSLGLGDRVKQKDDYLDGEPFMTFKVQEFRTDRRTGEQVPNKPPRVVDIKGNPWDGDKLIGNGSTVDVKFAVRDYGKGKPKGVYIRSVRVLDHVPYGGAAEFDPIDENDEFFDKARQAELVDTARKEREDRQFKKDFDLDDDVDDVM